LPVPALRQLAAAPNASQACPTLHELYRDHLDFVVRVARRLGGSRLCAEDVAQEVFLVVQRRRDSFEPRANVTTWLFGITFNVVRTMRRRLNLEAMYRAEESEGLRVPLVTRDPIEVREAWTLAADIFASMSPRKREVFLLGELDELPCAEIARIVGTKEATVWSRLHYARRHFEERLERRRRADAQYR
jgi:RNA polymerase sigma-70 factor (ECF subfamily)